MSFQPNPQPTQPNPNRGIFGNFKLGEGVKWFLVVVAAGVATGVAVTLITKQIESAAGLAAKAEVQRLLIAMAQAQTASQKSEVIPTQTYTQEQQQMLI